MLGRSNNRGKIVTGKVTNVLAPPIAACNQLRANLSKHTDLHITSEYLYLDLVSLLPIHDIHRFSTLPDPCDICEEQIRPTVEVPFDIGTNVRCNDNTRVGEEWMLVRQWFGISHIESYTEQTFWVVEGFEEVFCFVSVVGVDLTRLYKIASTNV